MSTPCPLYFASKPTREQACPLPSPSAPQLNQPDLTVICPLSCLQSPVHCRPTHCRAPGVHPVPRPPRPDQRRPSRPRQPARAPRRPRPAGAAPVPPRPLHVADLVRLHAAHASHGMAMSRCRPLPPCHSPPIKGPALPALSTTPPLPLSPSPRNHQKRSPPSSPLSQSAAEPRRR